MQRVTVAMGARSLAGRVWTAALGAVVLWGTAVLLMGCPNSPASKMQVDSEIGPAELVTGEVVDAAGGFGLCAPCVGDGTCQEGSCVPLADGTYCLLPCPSGFCDEGFSCQDFGEAGFFCQPEGGVCACDPGITDKKACARDNEFGTCLGLAACEDKGTWACDAPEPAAEECDGQDNDCDGETDEDFKVGEWYFGPDHCGECGHSCANAIEHGTGFCSMAPPPPACKVGGCDPGYYSPDGLTCVVLAGAACVACETDDDCPGGSCFEVGTGLFCLPDCTAECPEGYECASDASDPEGEGVCMPLTGSCECTPQTVGLVKTCANSNDFGTCLGYQVCDVSGWLPCDASVPAEEICDGKDNECDGVVDEELDGVLPCANTLPGVGSCAGFFQCEGEEGLVCDAPPPEPEICNYKDDNCDQAVDEAFVDPVSGKYTSDQDCGGCGNDCTVQVYPNAKSVCDPQPAVPTCMMKCNDLWVDLDKLMVNGCECPFISADDPPDGIDQNCDGIDGDPANAIFVSPAGSDTNPGTPELPVRTMGMGLQRCKEKAKKHLYVAEGGYIESIVLVDGVQVFGGFSPDFSVRKASLYVTTLAGNPLQGALQATVTGSGVGSLKSSFEGFVVKGPDVTTPGRSSYVFHLTDAGGNLAVRDNQIIAGKGGSGESGKSGIDGQDGAPGQLGKQALDLPTEGCNGSSTSGGPGGQHTCAGVDVSGGLGGASVCPDYDEFAPSSACPMGDNQNPKNVEGGASGLPAGKGGVGGSSGYDAMQTVLFDGKVCGWDYLNCSYCHVTLFGTDGQNGKGGLGGTNGAAGNGCVNTEGAVANGDWSALPGVTGGYALPGAGGGGGGAGGGVETHGCQDPMGGWDIGGSGGGGGSGGCAGSGGDGGTGGGGSFGIFLAWTKEPAGYPVLEKNQISTGWGGNGGSGGKGGNGGAGGWGGAGGLDGSGNQLIWCAGEGGAGGHGGNGGNGGGGGGGCGGSSLGIFVFSVTTPPEVLAGYKNQNPVTLAGAGGAGGQGGASKGNPGMGGNSGKHSGYNF